MKDNPELTCLRSRGFRLTPQRLAILEIIRLAGDHISPTDIVSRLQEIMPGANEATVYRTLDFFAEQGIIHRANLTGNQISYEISHDHHHLVCRRCGTELSLEHGLLEEVYQRIGVQTGFQMDTHHIIFHGVCPACQQKT
jgi:Fe2+ or Zn2+ uptake regulation protein